MHGDEHIDKPGNTSGKSNIARTIPLNKKGRSRFKKRQKNSQFIDRKNPEEGC